MENASPTISTKSNMTLPQCLLKATSMMFDYAMKELTDTIEPTINNCINEDIANAVETYLIRLKELNDDAEAMYALIDEGDYKAAEPLLNALLATSKKQSPHYREIEVKLKRIGVDAHTGSIVQLQNEAKERLADFLAHAKHVIGKHDALNEICTTLQDTKAAAERAANNTDTIIDELAMWREWVRQLATTQKNTTPAPKLCAAIQAKIVDLWQSFNAQPADCEDTTEPSGWRKHKRTYNECLLLHGNDDIWHGHKLKELTPTAKDLERVVHNSNEKQRQKKAKKSTARTPQALRKK